MLVYALHLLLQPVVCHGLRLSVLNSWIKKLYLLTYLLIRLRYVLLSTSMWTMWWAILLHVSHNQEDLEYWMRVVWSNIPYRRRVEWRPTVWRVCVFRLTLQSDWLRQATGMCLLAIQWRLERDRERRPTAPPSYIMRVC